MGYSNVQGQLNVYSSTSTDSLVVRNGATVGTLTVSGPSTFGVLTAANLTVTGNFSVASTNLQVTNALSINNSGTTTALKVVQYEGGVHNVAEFWDFQTLAMVIDRNGNVAIHAMESPNYTLTVGGTSYIDHLTAGLITGNGSGIANLQTTSLVGPVTALQLDTNQTNITSVGTLTSLAVTGAASAGWFVGGANTLSNINASNIIGFTGNTISNINASNIAIGALATTYLQNNQTNITSVGTLTSLAVTGAASAGWFVGSGNTLSNINSSNIIGFTQVYGNTISNVNISNVAIGALATTYLQNNQTNITSVGTLTSLAVTGAASAGWFVGSGNTLSNINSSNIIGFTGNTISNVNISNVAIGALATTYLQNNQTNITSVGTLTSLAVTGAASAGWFVGGGNTLSNLNASNIAIGALAATYLQNNQTNITSVGTLTSLAVTGAASAGWHVGGANTLSNVNVSNVAIGALATTYLQNNQTNITSVGTLTSLAVTGAATAGWFVGGANTLSNVNVSNVTIGALATTYLQNNQTNITSVGTLTSLAVTGAATAGWFMGGGNTLSNINSSNIIGFTQVYGNTISNVNISNVAIGALATTYLQNNQTNITSVGTLTSLAVTEAASAGWFLGGANTLSNVNISNVTIGALATTYLQNNQTNITSVGTLTSLAVTGAASAGWFLGGGNTLSNINSSNIIGFTQVSGNTLSNINASNIAIGALATTYLQNNQTNITSVGTLTSLAVTGAASAGWFVGGGNTLSNINSSNIIGFTQVYGNTISNVNISNVAIGALATTYLQNNQTNITSVGTLTSLAVTRAASAGWFLGGANTLSNVNISNVAIGALATTYLQNNQTNITSVGTLTSLAVTGAASAGWFVGGGNTLSNINSSNIIGFTQVYGNTISNVNISNVAIGALATTYLQNNQTNITSVGTLTSLAVTGAASAGWFIGGGNTLSNINSSNIIGFTQVSGNTLSNINASNIAIGALATTYLQNNQTNITSVGTLTSLAVTGAASAGWHLGGANTLSNVNISNVAIGALATTYLQNNQTNITSVGTLTSLAVTGAASAGWFVGGGNTLSNINSSNIIGFTQVSGNTLSNINASNIAIGALATTYLQNNQTNITSVGTLTSLAVTGAASAGWHLGGANTLSNVNISNVAIGALATTYLQNNQTNITSVGTLTSLTVTGAASAGWFIGGANTLSNVNISNVAIGALATTRLQNNQTNITSVGTLTSLAVTGAASAGWFIGGGNTLSNINSSNIIGFSQVSGNTLSNINASNIAFGILPATTQATNLYVANTLTVTNISSAGFTSNSTNTVFNFDTVSIPYATFTTATSTIFIGGANTLSNINASNITGFTQVSGNTLSNINASNIAIGALSATQLQAAQTNITSVGTLTSLAVTGAASAGWFLGGGNTLSNVNASNIAIGALATTRLQNNQTNITSVGTLTSLAVTGAASAGWFLGGGNTLSNVNASNIAFGAFTSTGTITGGYFNSTTSGYAAGGSTVIDQVGTISLLAGSAGIKQVSGATIIKNDGSANVTTLNVSSIAVSGSTPTSGYVLSTTGTGLQWIAAGGGGSSQWSGTAGSPIYYGPATGIGLTSAPAANGANLYVQGNVYVSNSIVTTNLIATGTITGQFSGTWSGTNQGTLCTLGTNLSTGTSFASSTDTPTLQAFHVPLQSFTQNGGYVAQYGITAQGLIKFNSAGLYQITAVFAMNAPVSRVALGTNTSSAFPATTSAYTYVYVVPSGTSPSTPITIPINVQDTSKWYYLDVFTQSSVTSGTFYATASATITGSQFGTYVQISPFGNYTTAVASQAAGLLITPSATVTLSSPINSNTYNVRMTSAANWTTAGTSGTIQVSTNGNLQFNQSGLYEVKLCFNSILLAPVQVAVGSSASDSSLPSTQGPYIYQYAPNYTQDPTTAIILPLNISDTTKYYYLHVTFPGSTTTVNIQTTSTFVSVTPIGSFIPTQMATASIVVAGVATALSGSYTASASDTYIGFTGGGTVTIPLGSLLTQGKIFTIKDESGLAGINNAYNITIQMSGTDLLDGNNNVSIQLQYAALNIMWTGANSRWSFI